MPARYRAFNIMCMRAVLCLVVCVACPAAAADLVENFDAGSLDATVWNDCQADSQNLIRFGRSAGRDFLVNFVDEDRVDADCYAPRPSLTASAGADVSEIEALGPSFVVHPEEDIDDLDVCPDPHVQNGHSVIQRNELRFRDRTVHGHMLDEARWYRFDYKIDGVIPTCGSVRWVTAQWKYDDQRDDGLDQSPFLAQRFDNGVFHITVQSHTCRCLIAQAAGDPNRQQVAELMVSGAEPRMQTRLLASGAGLRQAPPPVCVETDVASPNLGQACEPDLALMTRDGHEPPPLPDPKIDWVSMMYRVKGGSEGGGVIDIYANDRFIVRAQGVLGYRGGHPGHVKFKFGHYRDMIPYRAALQVDVFCVAETAEACKPGFREVR